VDGSLFSSTSLTFSLHLSQVINWAAKNENVKLLKKIIEMGGSNAYHELKDADDQDNDSVEPSNLLTNTPLMWASYSGHLRIVWLLLMDGYDADDLDPMGNNCLHLAASSGHDAILQILVDDGANPFISNIYKNRPIDVASTARCREILSNAMERYSTLEPEAIQSLHLHNVQRVCLPLLPSSLSSLPSSLSSLPSSLSSLPLPLFPRL
jgi:ankyrin repeat protein